MDSFMEVYRYLSTCKRYDNINAFLPKEFVDAKTIELVKSCKGMTTVFETEDLWEVQFDET